MACSSRWGEMVTADPIFKLMKSVGVECWGPFVARLATTAVSLGTTTAVYRRCAYRNFSFCWRSLGMHTLDPFSVSFS